ncbi:MAG: VWA domain-containing protein [Blastocatellia bacterium]|nr:VWA domain-containing protein [Blastocatellia bacterium]
MVSLKSARRAGLFILPFVILPFGNPTSSAQSRPFERSFFIFDKPQIIISNATTISIAPWDRNEVSLVAESSGAEVLDKEVKIKQNKNKLEVSFHPSKPDKGILLTLKVPPRSVLDINIDNTKIHIKHPVEPVKVSANQSLIHLDVPESTELDMEKALKARRYQQMQGARVTVGIGGRRSGKGPPHIKAETDRAVIVSHGPIEPPHRPMTYAAHVIARHNGFMGSSLRKSYPHLIRPPGARRDSVAAPLATEKEEGALRLETHLINLNISVTDRSGKAMPGLKQNDFSVYEDGVLQPISFFSPEESPFNLILLIDLSGSVRDKIDLIRETAIHFIDITNAQDSVGVITFTTDVITVSHLTRDREELRDRINFMQPPWGGTHFYDALGYVLIQELRRARGSAMRS